ncbi:MAG: serine/threonine-protein kinase [Roseofilum sp. SBFL]|uniref:serine/threonine-protein kinase n=1 Tax=unclassified Roseofilum TaxID=2620099 RepID=UPI001B09B5F4|nr:MULTISPECIES: serine/threonine-protein kinase [unclassified Roseofilum]MBP0013870.1 serine/threonine-protein kinase [Roseofilum sp. SID3]MBP0024719.1 serine/threonine-protein kinase [Roseofilum sp. SID2]MBP0038384.1 serine/threonine-protein kinase [Roseofilum sp. SID1]MBP0041111.1 serine/threonine-protein kinase [Roseofilum sp. SBFL]
MRYFINSTPAIGQVLGGHYEIEQELGQGGFGKTFLARDHHLPGHPLCVVKQLKAQWHGSHALKVAKRLFKTEAQTLQSLGEHPQIPRLLAFFEQEEEFYLVQEYIQGHELTQEIQEGKAWSELQAISLLRDILVSLDFVHQQGVIHRDLKPSNIIRRSLDNQLVLIDFGAVKQTLSELTPSMGKTSQTLLSVIVGSPNYMPSEQAIGRPKFSSDIYAVGIIVIQALTGTLPRDLPKDPETEEILWQPLASVSSELEAVLGKMVRYHFGDRYSCAAEALEAVNALSISPTSPPPPIPKAEPVSPDSPTVVSFSASIDPESSQPVTFQPINQRDRWGGLWICELGVQGKSIKLYQGDITNLTADVIVSSDDTYLTMGVGVSKQIRSIGGIEVYKEAQKLQPLRLGAIAATTAGYLWAKKIYHAAVMNFASDFSILSQNIYKSTIQQAVQTCLETANQEGFQSIAFPLLGTRVERFPALEELQIILAQIIQQFSEGPNSINEVTIAMYDKVAPMKAIKTVVENMVQYHLSDLRLSLERFKSNDR